MTTFAERLRAAQKGDPEALEWLLLEISPIIEKGSRYNGKLDDDLRQYLVMRIFLALKDFD